MDDPSHIVLTGRLGIAEVAEIQDTLKRAAILPDGVTVDTGNLQQVDTAGLQLLAAFARSARANGTELNWIAPPDSVQRAASLLGLEGVLGFSTAGLF